MADEQTAFFVIPPAHIAELRRIAADEPDAEDIDQVLLRWINQNRLYRRAEELAIHSIVQRFSDEHWTARNLFIHLDAKVGAPDKPSVLGPEDCAPWARAIDAYLDERGGLDWMLRDLARRCQVAQPPAHWLQEYHDLRAALDRAIADHAGVLYTWYTEGAEQQLADERAARAQHEARMQRRAAEPEPSPEEQARRLARWHADMDAWNHKVQLAEMNAPPDPDAPSKRMLDAISLYTVPGPIAERLYAMWTDHRRMLQSDDLSLWDRACEMQEEMKHLAWDEAREFWDARVRGHETAWQVLEDALLPRKPGSLDRGAAFIYLPVAGADTQRADTQPGADAQARADTVAGLSAAVQSWEASQGGRDAAIATIAAATTGNSRTHAADALSHLWRLIGAARAHGHGVVKVPFTL